MTAALTFSALVEYTDWEREDWLRWLRERGDSALEIAVGPHGDGRFQKIGEVVRHIFSAEKRYVERLSNLPLTDTATVPSGSVEALFEFGCESRRALQNFIETFPAEQWDAPMNLQLMGRTFDTTPRKIIAHVLLHEIRHWAQIATLFRFSGLSSGLHDFLFSPALHLSARGATQEG